MSWLPRAPLAIAFLAALLGVWLVLLAPARAASPDLARVYVERAERTERFTAEHLAHPPLAGACPGAPLLSFRREPGSPHSDAWYNAAQLMADAALSSIRGTPPDCRAARAVAFLDRLARDPDGFYPRANLDGSGVTKSEVFADDNAFIGLALLEVRAASADPALRAALLDRAADAARFLIESGLWDDTFGGGFWWSSSRGAVTEGKPAQTTALAALLFARLYEETAEPEYAEWARQSLAWLDVGLFDPGSGTYTYGWRHADPAGQRGALHDPRSFGYDQGIVIEVHLAFDRAIEPGGGHLGRARALAERLHAAFWDAELGGYRLDGAISEVYAIYAAWVSGSLLALHAADPDPLWRERARANLDALEAYLLDPADGGYFQMYLPCDDPQEPGCEAGEPWAADPTKLLAAQAWMQRAQALLAAALR